MTWTNQDSAVHTVTGDNGASYIFTFNQTGTFAYHCEIHPFMKGSVVVQ